MPPSVRDESASLEAIDWSIPCEHSQHRLFGGGDASWAAWRKQGKPCGHPIKPFKYFCDVCFNAMLKQKWVRCGTCKEPTLFSATVSRAERI